jgi:hypothetical protein
MFGVRALSNIGLERMAEAAEWGERAANSPGAHALIGMIAVAAHCLNGDDARARAWAQSVRERAPHLTRTDFMSTFPFRNEATARRISSALGKFQL